MKTKPPGCAQCPAFTQGKGFVPAEGPVDATIALLGQGPGETEAYSGRPFQGPSGWTLDRWLVRAGLERHKLYVSNVVWCWLPGNRAPKREEVDYCRVAHWGPGLAGLPQLKVLMPIGVPAGGTNRKASIIIRSVSLRGWLTREHPFRLMDSRNPHCHQRSQ